MHQCRPGKKAPACSPNFSPTTCNRHLTFGICDYFTVHDMIGDTGRAVAALFFISRKNNENDHFFPPRIIEI